MAFICPENIILWYRTITSSLLSIGPFIAFILASLHEELFWLTIQKMLIRAHVCLNQQTFTTLCYDWLLCNKEFKCFVQYDRYHCKVASCHNIHFNNNTNKMGPQ